MGKMHKGEKACWGVLICIFAIIIILEIIYFVLTYGISFEIKEKEFKNNSLAFPQLTFCPRNDSPFAQPVSDLQQYALSLFVPSAVNMSLANWDPGRINNAAQAWAGQIQNSYFQSGVNVINQWSYNCSDVFKSCAVGNNRFPCCQNGIFNVTSRGPCVVLPLRQMSDTINQNRQGMDGGLHIEINVANQNYKGGYLFLNDRYEYYIAGEPIPLQYLQNAEIFISLNAETRRSYCTDSYFWGPFSQLQRPAFYYNYNDSWYGSNWQWDWHVDQYWWFYSHTMQTQDWPGPDCYMGCLKQAISLTCGCTPYNLDPFGYPSSSVCNSTRNDQCVQPFLIANDPLPNCTNACQPMRRCREKCSSCTIKCLKLYVDLLDEILYREYNPEVTIVPWENAALYPPPSGSGSARQMIHIYHKHLTYLVNQEAGMYSIGETLHEIGALIILWVFIFLVIYGFIWLCKCCCCPNRVRNSDDTNRNNPPPIQPPVHDHHKSASIGDKEIGINTESANANGV